MRGSGDVFDTSSYTLVETHFSRRAGKRRVSPRIDLLDKTLCAISLPLSPFLPQIPSLFRETPRVTYRSSLRTAQCAN